METTVSWVLNLSQIQDKLSFEKSAIMVNFGTCKTQSITIEIFTIKTGLV